MTFFKNVLFCLGNRSQNTEVPGLSINNLLNNYSDSLEIENENTLSLISQRKLPLEPRFTYTSMVEFYNIISTSGISIMLLNQSSSNIKLDYKNNELTINNEIINISKIKRVLFGCKSSTFIMCLNKNKKDLNFSIITEITSRVYNCFDIIIKNQNNDFLIKFLLLVYFSNMMCNNSNTIRTKDYMLSNLKEFCSSEVFIKIKAKLYWKILYSKLNN